MTIAKPKFMNQSMILMQVNTSRMCLHKNCKRCKNGTNRSKTTNTHQRYDFRAFNMKATDQQRNTVNSKKKWFVFFVSPRKVRRLASKIRRLVGRNLWQWQLSWAFRRHHHQITFKQNWHFTYVQLFQYNQFGFISIVLDTDKCITR